MWLLLRVSLQTSLAATDSTAGNERYKSFMLFLLSGIMGDFIDADISGDLLFSMSAKVTRRLLKIRECGEADWLQFVKEHLREARRVLAERWDELTSASGLPKPWMKWISSPPSATDETHLKLQSLGPYLESAKNRRELHVTHTIQLKNIAKLQFGSNGLPKVECDSNEENARSCLSELGSWVETRLSCWVDANMENLDSCDSISSLLTAYLLRVSSHYKDNSDDTSRMILTTIDLWTALDKCVCHHCPLIRDYFPPLSSRLFESLLLPKKAQLEQLDRVEQYIRRRKAAAILDYPCILRCVDSPDSFTSWYVDQSERHQELLSRLLAKAEQDRCAKLAEFERLQKTMQIKWIHTTVFSVTWSRRCAEGYPVPITAKAAGSVRR